MPLDVGDEAPDFTKTTQEGEEFSLSKQREDKVIVLYFYPKDETPGCTAEACTFRDAYDNFIEAGAIVVGVSPDTRESHKQFADHHELPFLLVSDADGELSEAYDVPKSFGLLPGRVTYVIDKAGEIQHVFNSQFKAKRHVKEALVVVKRLASG